VLVVTGVDLVTGVDVVFGAEALGDVVLLVEVFADETAEAACACTARRETPAIAARAMEPLRLRNLRDMTCFLRSE
jgi:hypothetical protein